MKEGWQAYYDGLAKQESKKKRRPVPKKQVKLAMKKVAKKAMTKKKKSMKKSK